LDDDVTDACTLEGDSSDEEDAGGLTSEAVISLYGKTDWFLPVEDELFVRHLPFCLVTSGLNIPSLVLRRCSPIGQASRGVSAT
jgi:hypothetical protein